MLEDMVASMGVGALAAALVWGVRCAWYAGRARAINRAKAVHPAYSNRAVEPRVLRDPRFTTPQPVFTEEMLDRVTIRPVVRGSLPRPGVDRPNLILPPAARRPQPPAQ